MADYRYAGVKQLRKLLDAVMAVGSELSLSVVLRRITEAAAELVDARFGALGVLDSSGTKLAEFITVGLDADEVARIGKLPEGHGILGLLIVDPKPLRLPDLTAHADSFGFPPGHPPMQSFLGVPILLRGEVFGNLYLTDKADGDVFTDVDEELVVALASAAGLAIENARLHASARDHALAEERERVARDLHDDVIQRLFATGLSLQSMAQAVLDQRVVDRLIGSVDEIDETIRRLRSTIFQLRRTSLGETDITADVAAVCHEASRVLGFEPSYSLAGPLRDVVPSRTAAHLVLALREALSNVARHADATKVEVSVAADETCVRLTVSDNGRGFDASTAAGDGLRNIARRATELGGTSNTSPAPGGGTTLVWEVPIDRDVRPY